jgi:hypothetical protein
MESSDGSKNAANKDIESMILVRRIEFDVQTAIDEHSMPPHRD